MSDYKVEKDRFPVKLFFTDGATEEGQIYLSLRAAHHEGHESPQDLLNQQDVFLPVHFPEGPTRLVNKDHLLMVSFPSGEEEEEEEEQESFVSSVYEVILHLTNHLQLEGKFVFLLPTHSSRVKDYLNQPQPFVSLRKEGEAYLINRKHIIAVQEKQR